MSYPHRFVVLFAWLLGVLGALPACAANVDAQSLIRAVTVFPDRALVTRSATVTVEPGRQRVLFEPLPNTAQADSMRVKGIASTARVRLLGVETQTKFLQETNVEKVRELEASLEELQDKQQALQDETALLQSQTQFVEAIRQSVIRNATRELAIDSWERMLEFTGTHRRTFAEAKRKADSELKHLQQDQERIQNELNLCRGGSGKQQLLPAVDLNVQEPGEVVLELTYLVTGCQWHPEYDLYARPDSATLEITYLGNVQNQTGENWEDVKLSLSTARPAISGNVPELQPWWLRVAVPRPMAAARGEWVQTSAGPDRGRSDLRSLGVAAENFAEGVPSATGSAYFGWDIAGGVVQTQAAIVEMPSEHSLAVTFTIPTPRSIPCDGTWHRATVQALTLPVEMEHITVPRQAPQVFLAAMAKNDSEATLLAGPVRVFVDEQYLATSQLASAVVTNATFVLGLGVDDAVTVKRQPMAARRGDTGIIRKSDSLEERYQITVANKRKQPIHLTVKDQIPVSQDEKIVVDQVAFTPEPQVEKELGIVRWKLTLAAGEEKALTMAYRVRWPEDVNVQGI